MSVHFSRSMSEISPIPFFTAISTPGYFFAAFSALPFKMAAPTAGSSLFSSFLSSSSLYLASIMFAAAANSNAAHSATQGRFFLNGLYAHRLLSIFGISLAEAASIAINVQSKLSTARAVCPNSFPSVRQSPQYAASYSTLSLTFSSHSSGFI